MLDKLEEFIKQMVATINRPRAVGSASYEPVYYIVYPPAKTRQMVGIRSSLMTALTENGHTVHEFDCFKAVWDICETDDCWEDVKEMVASGEVSNEDLQMTLTDIVDGNGQALVKRMKDQLTVIKNDTNPVLFVTGLEALHQIMRPGVIENRLNGEFHCPVVFFYPGTMSGKAGLSFFGIYPVDSNYRSEHFAVPFE